MDRCRSPAPSSRGCNTGAARSPTPRISPTAVLRFVSLLVLALLASACHLSPETRTRLVIAYLDLRLGLDDAQEAPLEELRSYYLSRRPLFVADRTRAFNVLLAEAEKDDPAADVLIDSMHKRLALFERETPAFVARMADFHRTLTRDQKETLIDLIDGFRKDPPKGRFAERLDDLRDDLNLNAADNGRLEAMLAAVKRRTAPFKAREAAEWVETKRQLLLPVFDRDWLLGAVRERFAVFREATPEVTMLMLRFYEALDPGRKQLVRAALKKARDDDASVF